MNIKEILSNLKEYKIYKKKNGYFITRNKHSEVETLAAQLQYVKDWSKKDFLDIYPNLDEHSNYIVQVYETCRILAKVDKVFDKVWNVKDKNSLLPYFSKRLDYINDNLIRAKQILNQAIGNLS